MIRKGLKNHNNDIEKLHNKLFQLFYCNHFENEAKITTQKKILSVFTCANALIILKHLQVSSHLHRRSPGQAQTHHQLVHS